MCRRILHSHHKTPLLLSKTLLTIISVQNVFNFLLLAFRNLYGNKTQTKLMCNWGLARNIWFSARRYSCRGISHLRSLALWITCEHYPPFCSLKYLTPRRVLYFIYPLKIFFCFSRSSASPSSCTTKRSNCNVKIPFVLHLTSTLESYVPPYLYKMEGHGLQK